MSAFRRGVCETCSGIQMVTRHRPETKHTGEVLCLGCGRHHKWAAATDLSWAPWASPIQTAHLAKLRPWEVVGDEQSAQGSLL